MFDRMISAYPTLVEAYIEFKIEWRKLIAKNNGKEYAHHPDYETCDHSSNYKLQKDESSGKVYCLKEG